jgi:hypothetical protein
MDRMSLFVVWTYGVKEAGGRLGNHRYAVTQYTGQKAPYMPEGSAFSVYAKARAIVAPLAPCHRV